jgi:hypothetical protein
MSRGGARGQGGDMTMSLSPRHAPAIGWLLLIVIASLLLLGSDQAHV